MLDFSNRTELNYLAELARAFGGAVEDTPYFLAGATARDLLLPGGETMRIVSLPALVVLKLVAWEERRWRRPGTDAHDIAVILRHYLDAGNHERLHIEAPHMVEAPDFDYEEAGAWLLGHDMARLLPDSARPRLADLLNRECDANGQVHLVGDLPIEADRGLGLLQHLAKGFMETVNR